MVPLWIPVLHVMHTTFEVGATETVYRGRIGPTLSSRQEVHRHAPILSYMCGSF